LLLNRITSRNAVFDVLVDFVFEPLVFAAFPADRSREETTFGEPVTMLPGIFDPARV
jgi:hypothetical protein